MLLNNSLMPIDTQSFLSLTKRLPTESSVSRDQVSSISMMTSILRVLEFSESLPERMSTVPTVSSSVSLRFPKDLVKDYLNMLVSRPAQLPDTSDSTTVILTSSLLMIYPKKD
jgi:hypothetical protein